MDVIKIDKAGSTYLATDLVEGYDSMIWTERFYTPGDFQMLTSKIKEMRTLIPEGSLISLMDSEEVMIVETHKITTDDAGDQVLQINGRSATSILESRVFGGELTGAPGTDRYKLQREGWERAGIFIYDSIVQVPTYPISVGIDRPVYDQIPNVMLSDSHSNVGTQSTAVITFGTALDIVSGLILVDHLGLRTLRPGMGRVGGVEVTYDQAWGPAHLATRAYIGSPTAKLRFDTYDGQDRSAANVVGNPPIIFDYQAGTLDHPTYMWSIKDYRNMLVLWDSVGEQPITNDPSVPYTTAGWDRRDAFLDGSNWDQVGTDSGAVYQDIAQRSLIEIAKLTTKSWFDGEVSKVSPYKYKKDFFLGDLVTLRADYGFIQSMRVTEFIRTHDTSGDRGYPTLITP